jgi:predicted ATPase
MQKIIVHQLGPVEHCELEINDFIVFTGPQASGKSTIAKSVFFFKNIRKLLVAQIRKRYTVLSYLPDDNSIELSLKGRMLREIRSNFLQIFGSTWCMSNDMQLQYYYTDDIYIKVSLKTDPISPNYIWIEFSKSLSAFLNRIENEMKGKMLFIDISWVSGEIDKFFQDDEEIVYIPAGRSMITLLSTQLDYIYSSMDDEQKRTMDYCTRNYMERIMQLKAGFSLSPKQLVAQQISLTDKKINKNLLDLMADLMHEILGGEYRSINGEERLLISDDRYVKINFASSGQQESVWILNVIFYYILHNKKTYYIIEEPESHLFPNAQKLITEFVTMAKNGGQNGIFITTHSPYILGTINNLLYADKISSFVNKSELQQIVAEDKWISFENLSAFYIEKGIAQECVDREFRSIRNEIIDGASEDINNDYEKMVCLKEKYAVNEGTITL